MYGGDNSSHLQLLKANDFNKGFSIHENNRYNTTPNLRSYPQGWHFNAVLLKWVIEPLVPISPHPVRIMAFFYAYSVAWLGILSFIITQLAFLLLPARKRSSLAASVAVPVVCAIGIAGWIIPLFASAFQAQLCALAYLLLEVICIVLALRKPMKARSGYVAAALFATIAITFMWVFIVPVAALGFLACLWPTLWHYVKKRPSVITLTLSLGMLVIGLAQAYIAAASPGAGGGIDVHGYVPLTTMYPMIGVAIACTLAVYFYPQFKGFRTLYFFSILALAFSLILMAYQLSAFDELRYYYFKSTYTYIVLAIIGLAFVAAQLLDGLLAKRELLPRLSHQAFIVSSFLVIGVMCFVTLKSVEFDHYTQKNLEGIGPDQAAAITSILEEDSANGYRIAPIGSCNRGDDIRAQLLAYALTYTPYSQTGPRLTLELSELQSTTVFSEVRSFIDQHHTPVYLVSRDQSLTSALLDYLGANSSYVRVTDIDPDPVATAATHCPDRLQLSQ
jgi:hypothetical protein